MSRSRRSACLLALGGAICAAAASAQSSTLWTGDYETRDLSQWARVQAVPGDVAIVDAPVRQGGYAAQFTVKPGDAPLGDGSERSEVEATQAQTGGFERSEQWYGWSTLFPSNLNPTPRTPWNYFVQFHDSQNDGCGPNVVLGVDTGKNPPRIKLRVRGGAVSLSTCAAQYDRSWEPAALAADRWLDFVLHVRWSSDPRVGFVEAWIGGTLVVPRTYTATLYTGDGVYLKEGFYRKPSQLTSTVYQDAMRRGDSYADVVPRSASG